MQLLYLIIMQLIIMQLYASKNSFKILYFFLFVFSIYSKIYKIDKKVLFLNNYHTFF